jgi:hypothetical protein
MGGSVTLMGVVRTGTEEHTAGPRSERQSALRRMRSDRALQPSSGLHELFVVPLCLANIG